MVVVALARSRQLVLYCSLNGFSTMKTCDEVRHMRGPDLKSVGLARRLRTAQTNAENTLWDKIRSRRLDGHKFVRQLPVAEYICDFICRERRLIVEIDGGQHSESKQDVVRDRRLAEEGYRVLRFWNNDVLGNIEGVLTLIQDELTRE
ncbi:endonuclease domain-containing protein [Bradyrhizobium sp. HKCCYLRH3061]|uniref:endonuclease domain-containing protein n=1 Tax=Bradyrhizobium TaxID=374 RepID=UPI003EBD5DCD